MKGVGIFGGTFDPIHIGHLIIAEQALDSLKLEKIIFIPNGNPPHKSISYAKKDHRLKMIQLAIEDNRRFEVSDIEINKTEKSYTVDTILSMKKIVKDEVFFIMGSDSLINIKSWYQYEKLLECCNFIILPRVLNNLDEKIIQLLTQTDELIDENNIALNINYLKKWIEINLNMVLEKFFFIDFPLLEISSTTVRKNILDKRSINYLVPSKVIQYIYEENLY